ncbi:unnamed protein product [Ostreobium quekettii]|uniref:SSD domain-containing protein n=1 Tax=Ostreobium quekettii TaxID=121088 RepID=A0A8S1JDU7_9CHLO|nr:unnamed protein product [Ostreobium quekettii]|eukprot:evm.model.scf_238EXC.2 EVM.evm.TU.scf_238EXC.2   scf_238EXC:8099-18289(-)
MAPEPPAASSGDSSGPASTRGAWSSFGGASNAEALALDVRLSLLSRISCRIHRDISAFFEAEGRFVYRRPRLVIGASIAFAGMCAVMFFTLFEQELDSDRLFTPESSQAFRDREYVEGLYGDPPVQTRVLITRRVDLTKEPQCRKRDLLVDQDRASRFLMEVFDLYEDIQAITVTEGGDVLTLGDICAKPVPNGPCLMQSVLDAWNYSREALESDTNISATLSRGNLVTELGLPLDTGFVVGRNQEGGQCDGNAEVYQFQFILRWETEDINGKDIDPRTHKWLRTLVDVVRDHWRSPQLEGFVSDLHIVDSESERGVVKDTAKLPLGYILVGIYSHVVMFKNSPAFNKTHLAGMSYVSVILAIVSAFGMAQALQVKFNLVTQTLPFLLLGLGMDDAFIIVGAYHQTDACLAGEERVAQAMRRAGSSILVTSMTDLAAFLMGLYTELPALRAFAAHACLGITFDFIFQVTFFVAFLALDAEREKRALNGAPMWGFQCCCWNSESNGAGPPIANMAAKRRDEEKAEVQKSPESESVPVFAIPDIDNVCNEQLSAGGKNWKRKIFGKGDYDPAEPSLSTRMIGCWLPQWTLHPAGKVAVILAEAGLLAWAIYGLTMVRMDFKGREWFTPKDSWLQNVFKLEELYFAGDSTKFQVYTKEAPPDLPSYYYFQDGLARLEADLMANDKYVSDSPPVRSWYGDFCSSLEPGSRNCSQTRLLSPLNFDLQVHNFTLTPQGAVHRPSLVFDPPFCLPDARCRIVSSKLEGFSKDVVDGQYAVDLVDSLRETARGAVPELRPIAYDPLFLFYDGFRVIQWETVRNVVLAGVAVFGMSLVILANVFAAALVLGMVAATDVMLLGWMHYVDLTFNPVTAVNVVLAVGIAVDYSAHVAHTFLVAQGSRQERARGALLQIGGDVFSGAFTTFLAVVAVAAAEHYIFQVSFKMFFAIVIFGVWHGLVVLPVLLSLVGPPPYVGILEERQPDAQEWRTESLGTIGESQ